MRFYETTFVINPQTDDSTINAQVNAIADLIKTNNGKIVHEDRMGTRKMAYEIKGLTQGYYTSLVFEGPIEILPVLDRYYRLEESYLRFLTIRYEQDPAKLKEEKPVLMDRKKETEDEEEDKDPGRGRREEPNNPPPATEAASNDEAAPVEEASAPEAPENSDDDAEKTE